MTVLSIMASFVCVWAAIKGQGASAILERLKAFRPTPRLVGTCAALIVPIYVIALLNLYAQVRLEEGAPFDAWMQALPLPVYNGRTQNAAVHSTLSLIALCCGLVATLSLGVLAAALRHGIGRTTRRAFGVIAVLLAVVSVAAPAMSTTDPYEYVAAALLGLRAYVPPPGVLAGTIYAPILPNIPLSGVIYGPLWVLVNSLQLSLGTSVFLKIELLRVWNVAFIGLLYVLLGRAGVSRNTRALFVVNPALWYYVVANPHADVQGLLLIVGAWIAAQRSRGIFAAVLLAGAGLIKLPFLLIGAAALAPLNGSRRRYAVWFGAAFGVALVSFLIPGAAYWHDFSHYVVHGTGHAHANLRDGWLLIAPIVAAVTVALLARRRAVYGAAWLFPQIAPLAAAWYLLWGMPYAAVTGTLEAFVIAMPLATVLIDSTNSLALPGIAIAAALGVFLIVDLSTIIRSRQTSPIVTSV
jgi:hypothetical protein